MIELRSCDRGSVKKKENNSMSDQKTQSKEALTSTKDLKRVLGFWDLMAVSVGSIIGSGIMSLTGYGIGRTGRSIFIAFFIGAFIVVLARSPQIFLNSVARFRGGDYTMVGTFLGPRWSGTYSMIALLTSVTLGMYALSFADYVMPFVPWIGRRVIAFLILTILFITNFFGVNVFSKVQNITVIVLVISLTIFTVVGLTKVQPGYFNPETFMTNGFKGLWSASVLMSYTCDGCQYVTQLGAEAKRPTRDIPVVMLVSTLGVALLYGLMGIVAAGVLPLDQVVDKPLGVVAEAILSKPLYLVFVIGGAWMALLTTLNSSIATCTRPLMQACNDGWYPNSLARLHPKFRTPIILMLFYYVIGLVPIVFDLNLGVVGDMTIAVGSITKFMVVLSLVRMPKVLPEAWKKSRFHISTPALMLLALVDGLVIVISGVTSAINMPIPLLVGNLAVVVFAFGFGAIRYRTGKVKLDDSYEIVVDE
ncbi:MAG: APC family permease [Saccharofermentanales bacterium]